MTLDWLSLYIGFIVGGLLMAIWIAVLNEWLDRKPKKGRAAD